MKINFYKYQGTGNDFVMIDNRLGTFPKEDRKRIAYLCDRKFGIGADGLILLEHCEKSDFKMVYFNSDGNESTMCGNGGRCIVSFANFLEIIGNETTFSAIDGLHHARIKGLMVDLKMQDVTEIKAKQGASFLNTGSPHHVQIVSDLSQFNVVSEGAKLRYGLYGQEGSNINFVEEKEHGEFFVRTYERGVENETLSCGTGVTAVALVMHHLGMTKKNSVKVHVLGGGLAVTFAPMDKGYEKIYLIGEAKQVFKGEVQWNS
ncbi:diaminopimelate epimerase [Maribacter chungangensis]|uniref:Diaminopimelate epimerase n=1 Tax=Maribacter chungangensis TaxID=1069117 RepID=A0ABW3B4A0_9FLAO